MASDLNSEIKIGADASGVEAGVSRAKRSLKDLTDAARVAGDGVATAGEKASKGLAGMGDGGEAAARKLQRDTASMQGSLQRYLSTLEAGSKDSRKYWETMADFKGIDKNALNPLLDKLDSYRAKTTSAQEATASWAVSFGGIGAAAAGIAAVTASVGVAAKAMFEASASAERLRTMLDFSTGGNSAKEIEYLRSVTYRLGLEFSSTAKAYGQFQAAAKGTALEGDKARAVFESVAKASAVMGLSAADTSGVLLALQQMISKGTVQAEELRGQLGERLPGAFQVAAKAMGVTTAELGKMLEQGQVVADDFLPKFAVALEKNLGGAAESAANRLDAAVNRFENAWERLKKTGGDSGVSKAVSNELAAITRDIDAVSDGMERARRAGGGMFAELGSGAAVAAGRVAFSTLNLAANSLNGTINALTGGIFGLRTDLALLPDVFKTDAQYAKALADRLAEAEAKMAALQGTGASTSANPYIRSSFVEVQEYIKELKKAQAEQAKLTGSSQPDSKINPGIVASGKAREAYYNQRAKDEDAANAFRLNQAGVPASYLKDMAELIRLNQAGVIVGKEYTDALKKQQDELLKKTGAVKSSNAAANQEQNAYESLIASIRAKIEADNLEIAGGAALTESQRIRIKLDQDLAAGRVKLTAQNERAVRLALEELAASEASALAAKTLAKANLDAAASREKYLTSLSTGLDKIKADTAAQLEATARLGLSKEAIAELDAAKLEMLATDLELQAIKAMDRNLDEQTYNALKQQAEAYRELAAAKKAGATKEMALDLEKANREAAKKAADEWQRAADDIERALTDSLLRGFESGKGFAENLIASLKNMFSTLVLRPIISAAMSPVAGAINGMLYGNAAAAAGGGANALGMIGSGANLINGLQGTQGVLGTVGGWLGMNTVATNTAIAANLGIDAASAAAAANGAAAAGSSGFMGTVGSALPWIAGAAALYSIISSLDDSGTLHTGGAAQYSAATGLRTSLGFRDNEEGLPSYNPNDNIDNQFGTGFGYVERGDQTIDVVSNLARGLGTALDGVAVAFGQRAGYEIATAFADDTSKDGAWGALRISKDGQELLNWQDTRTSRWAPKEFGDGEAGYKEYLAAVAKDTRQVLLDMDLPSWADKMLESIGDSASMDQLTGVLTQIGVVQSAFVGLGNSMEMFANLSDEMQSGLLAAAGSIDALTAGAGAFYQGFYSEQERIDAAVAQLNEALTGLDLSIDPTMGDDAKAQFRAAVEAAFAAGDADLAAGLLSISGNFATAADYFEQLSQSAAQAAEQAAQVAERPAAEQASIASDLRRQIYELTGDTAAIRQLEIAGMNAANIALYDRVQALQAEAEQAAIRADLERQVLELTGDTAAIRQLEIAGMDAANVALYDRIQALQSEQQAAEAAAQAAAEQANISESLNRQLIQLTGDTAAIRQLEIAGMNAANVALYDRIQALQSEQQAQAEAQRAAEQAAQAQLEAQQRTAETMQRLQIELYRAQGDNLSAVVLERERELAALAQFGPAAVAMQQQIYGLIDAMAASNAAAASYFAGIDRIAAEQGYNEQAQSAIDALFGAVGSGAASASQAAADAAKSAAASWRSAASSIQSSLDKLRASTTALSDPASRYAETKSVLDEYTRLALGGDASAAEKLAGAADAFLSASEGGTLTQAEYLRDRVLTEAKLASVMESSEAQASLQESIATAASAAVSELQTLNNNLTGFAGDLYDLLRSSAYSGVGREDATGIAATFAKMQADFEAYFSDNANFAVGSQYSDPSFGGASFTKLDNNIAKFTGAEGVVNYLRAGESLLDVAKRIPELRALWEKQYGIKLPAFDVGTNYVPHDMVAQIHEGEAIVPKAFNPWANGGSTGRADNAEVVAELRGLSAQLSRLEARLAEIEKTNDQMAQQQDNGTDGGNAYRAEIMNVAALAQAIKEATV